MFPRGVNPYEFAHVSFILYGMKGVEQNNNQGRWLKFFFFFHVGCMSKSIVCFLRKVTERGWDSKTAERERSLIRNGHIASPRPVHSRSRFWHAHSLARPPISL